MNIIIFGVGKYGTKLKRYCEVTKEYNVVAAIDNKFKYSLDDNYSWRGVKIVSPLYLREYNYDKVFISVMNSGIADRMKNQLIELGVNEEDIVCIFESEEFIKKLNWISNYDDNNPRVNWVRSFARFINDEKIEGNVAECGVLFGDFSVYLNAFFTNKKLYMFDTFDGFPEDDVEMDKNIGNTTFMERVKKNAGQLNMTNVDMVLERMPYREQCITRKGYFPDTAIGLENEKFCFVNLDMDLYKPQLEGLRFFYNRMVRGGVILLHDYYHPDLPGVKLAIEDFKKEHAEDNILLFPIGDSSSMAIIKN